MQSALDPVDTEQEHARLSMLERIWRDRNIPATATLIARNSAYSVVGLVVPAVALLIATPLLVHQLGTIDYGLWVLTTSFLGVLGFFDLGLSTALGKYIAQFRATDDIGRLSASATMGFVLYLLIAAVLTPVVFFTAPYITTAIHGGEASSATLTTAIRLASLAIAPMLLKNAALAVPIGLQRYKMPMAMSILQVTLTLGLALAAAFLTGSVSVVVATTVAAIWVTAAVSCAYAYLALSAIHARWVFSIAHLRTIAGFMMFTAGTALGGALFASLDRIVVGAVAGLSAVAYYAVSISVAQNLLTMADVVARPLMPASSVWASNEEWARVRRWLVRSTALIAALEFFAATVLLAVSEPFMTAWMGASFTEHALSGFRILIVVFAVAAVGASAFHIANGTGYPWAPTVGGTVGGLLTLALIVLLAPIWGVTGAAAANVGGLLSLFPLVYMWRKLEGTGDAGRFGYRLGFDQTWLRRD
jgi:O-antigen/teichoic acid export membrane protein